ncbi:hypothetical protein D9756_005740 [Leucocoprinus leucothites]|uniref:DUF6697 domain-containing protein n=1 Tax=Leucocoprinus leucothites TaxID=201217 RepID=A0A8H5D7R1_9AGAR|nr:hypothetical protein D9756_005740 [Leucoagaricus leucothites]
MDHNAIRDKFREENAKLKRLLYNVEVERDKLLCENVDLRADLEKLRDEASRDVRVPNASVLLRQESIAAALMDVEDAQVIEGSSDTEVELFQELDIPSPKQNTSAIFLRKRKATRSLSPDLEGHSKKRQATMTEVLGHSLQLCLRPSIDVGIHDHILLQIDGDAEGSASVTTNADLEDLDPHESREQDLKPLVFKEEASDSQVIKAEPDVKPFWIKQEIKVNESKAFMLTTAQLTKFTSEMDRFPIEPPPVECKFPRQLLTEMFGTSTMSLLWESQPESPRKLRFIFPTFDVNPYMPSVPGGAGLLLSCREEMTEHTFSLFIRVETKPRARWVYAGEYESRHVGNLEGEAFQDQNEKVKETWANKIIDNKSWPVYFDMKARIELRKEREIIDSTAIEERVEMIKERKTELLTTGDVIRAFESGEESIKVILMKCTGYNHVFAREIEEKWNPRSKGSRATPNSKKAAIRRSQGRKAAVHKHRERRSSGHEESDDPPPLPGMPESDTDGAAEPPDTRMTTRSMTKSRGTVGEHQEDVDERKVENDKAGPDAMIPGDMILQTCEQRLALLPWGTL